jgi:hypothetical protein
MTTRLYWIVYHLDLGPVGPRVLDLAVRSWLKRARDQDIVPMVRRRVSGWLTTLHLRPSFVSDARM